MTQGLASIGAARHVVLVVSARRRRHRWREPSKARLLHVAPRPVLQLHPHATVVVDEAAAVELELADYYRETYAGKPAWQHL